MWSHWMIPGSVFAVALTEVGAANGATPAHFAAVGATITGIVAVIKGYDWVEHKVQEKIKAALDLHGAEDQLRYESLKGEILRIHETMMAFHGQK